jgi:O-antigen ligase
MLEANYFAFFQVFIIPVLMFLLARFRRPLALRVIILAAIAGAIFTLMLSFSRGGFVGLMVIFACLLFIERRNKAVMAFAAVAVAILAVAAPALYWDRIISIFEAASHLSRDYAVMVRVKTLEVAARLGLENPVFGAGIGNFIYQSSRFVPFMKVVHSAFLQIFSELGFPGLIVVSVIFVRNLAILRSMMRSHDPQRARLGRFMMVQQIAVAFNAMFIPVGYEFIFWLTLAVPSLADIAYSENTPEPSLT